MKHSQPRQNASINVIKFILSQSIVLLHCAMLFGFPRFQGGWIYVEWFYIFAGYTLAGTILGLSHDAPVLKTGLRILWKRIRSVFPCYVISVALGLLVKYAVGAIEVQSLGDIGKILAEILMLQMFRIPTAYITGTSWFLSAMWIALIVLIPIMMVARRKFTRYIAPVMTLAIYFFIQKRTGYLWEPDAWMGFAYKGTLRALAGISLGAFAYEIGTGIKDKLSHPVFDSICIWVVYGLILVLTTLFDDAGWFYFLPFIFTILIAVQMNKKDGLDFPDSSATRLLGKLSMVIYMNHYCLIDTIEKTFPSMQLDRKILIAFISITIAVSIVMFIETTLRKCHVTPN